MKPPLDYNDQVMVKDVKYKRCLSKLSFINNKLKNDLMSHLDLLIRMFAKKITLHTFPYVTTNACSVAQSLDMEHKHNSSSNKLQIL